MKKQTLLFLLMLMPLMARAYDAEINGIYYNLNQETKEAEVTNSGTLGQYNGDIIIPETVSFEGVIYSVISIGNSVFEGCTNLTSITIPNSVTTIEEKAFYGCTSLTSVNIPNHVTYIANETFSGCTALTSITIPNSVTYIGLDAFYKTAWLDNQPNGLVYAGKVAYQYKGEMPENTSVVLDNGTLGIAGYAFFGCSGLSSITIPNSVTYIGVFAFAYCI